MKTVVIDGKEYELVPVERESVLDLIDEVVGYSKPDIALPKRSEYREKFKNRTLTPVDLARRRGFGSYTPISVKDPNTVGDPNFTGAGLEYDV